jgi:DNA-directed RNA polymerase beta subunit
MEINDNRTYEILEKCYTNKNILKQLKSSYDEFLSWLNKYICNSKIIEQKFEVHFIKSKVRKCYFPINTFSSKVKKKVYPEICRIKNLNYSGDLIVDVVFILKHNNVRKQKTL